MLFRDRYILNIQWCMLCITFWKICSYVYISISVGVTVCICVCMSVYLCVCFRIHMGVSFYISFIHCVKCMNARNSLCKFECVCVFVIVWLFVRVFVCFCVCACVGAIPLKWGPVYIINPNSEVHCQGPTFLTLFLFLFHYKTRKCKNGSGPHFLVKSIHSTTYTRSHFSGFWYTQDPTFRDLLFKNCYCSCPIARIF